MRGLEPLKFKIAADITNLKSIWLAAEVGHIDKIADLIGKVDPDQFAAIKHDYYQSLALMANDSFKEMVMKCRLECKIPVNGHIARASKDIIDRVEDWLRNQAIYDGLNVSRVVMDNIANIITYNTFLLRLRQSVEIVVDRDGRADLELDEYYEGDIQQLSIRINAPVTKNRLLNFVEDNWQKLNALIEEQHEQVNEEKSAYISDRDMRIVALRDHEGMTFDKISGVINDEFKNSITLGENNVKTAYYDAKKKINALYDPPKATNAR